MLDMLNVIKKMTCSTISFRREFHSKWLVVELRKGQTECNVILYVCNSMHEIKCNVLRLLIFILECFCIVSII